MQPLGVIAGVASQCCAFRTTWRLVVHALNKRSVKNPLLMHLLRALFFIEAHFSLLLRAEHIAEVSNSASDNLSRDNLTDFFVSCPQADPLPSPLSNRFTLPPTQPWSGLAIPKLVPVAQRYFAKFVCLLPGPTAQHNLAMLSFATISH